MASNWQALNRRIENCQKCPRLIRHCHEIATNKRKAYADQEYWGKPVPNFGPSKVPVLIVGLAPGAHGANRTGRMFTGDRSGDWLYRALFKAGFCNQPASTFVSDGLTLKRCAITAVCHCAPPDNKPTSDEISQCSPFLDETIQICQPRVFLALGSIAWKAIVRYSIDQSWLKPPQPKFGHGQQIRLLIPRRQKETWLIGCYHPSQQNTFTGRLTEKMLDNLLGDVNNLIDS